MNSVQQTIAEIAYEKKHAGVKMTFPELRAELKARGRRPGIGRGLYRQVSTTYKHALKEGNEGVADAIATVFVDKNGNYYWG